MDIEHIVVHKGTDHHGAFPDIIRLDNGELVCVFRQVPLHPGTGIAGDAHEVLVHHHEDSRSRIVLVRSDDDSWTWDPDSHTIIDASDGDYDLNLAVVSQVSSGELVVNSMRAFQDPADPRAVALKGKRHVTQSGVYHEKEGILDGMYLVRSTDRGQTWGEPEPFGIPSLAYWSHTGKGGVVELPDGTWLVIFSGRDAVDQTGGAYVARSRDRGATWGQPSVVAYDPDQRIGFGEPPLLRLPSGKLLTMMRTTDYLYQAFSTDDGWVWQGLRRSPIWGFPCHLLRLSSGRVLCAYGYRREPYGIRACVSDDEGETWDIDNEIIIRDDGLHRDLGYPASVELKDGRVLTVYYFHGEDGIRYIGGSVYSAE